MSKCVFARLCPYLGCGDAPKAVVKNGMLVLSLTNAISPVIWRLSLTQVAASAIEVQAEASAAQNDVTAAKNNLAENNIDAGKSSPQIYNLVLKNQKSILNVIASFSSRDAAVKALRVMMRAMENAQEDDFILQAGMAKPVMAGHQDQNGSLSVATGGEAGLMVQDKPKGLKGRPILSGFIGAAIVILLLVLLMIFTPRPPSALSGASLSTQLEQSTGSAVSADDFLRQKGL